MVYLKVYGETMPSVNCVTLDGRFKSVPIEDLTFRPAAYAILVYDRNILLTKMKANGKYHLPGGGIEMGERIKAALHREVYEETGIKIREERLVDFEELFFYYDPSGHAYHGLHFYFLCKPVTRDLITDDQVADGSAEKPRWVAIDGLKAGDFQHNGEKVLDICQQNMGAASTFGDCFYKDGDS